jgi:oxygen-independent coproporphyrinogen-3 oxidase
VHQPLPHWKHDITVSGAGCYIHIPFCAGKCPYCDFYSLPRPAEALLDRYTAETVRRLAAQAGPWRSLYLGGGTPSLLGAKRLGEILRAAEGKLLPGAEVTVECNPSSTDEALCYALAEAGCNRISLGLQSAVPEERRRLGRGSGLDRTAAATEGIRRAGIGNFSLDVMLGIPGQTEASLRATLSFCLTQGARHLSCYLLTAEEGTPFARLASAGALSLPDEDAQRALYLCACAFLEERGCPQYEISNFAQPGYESRHNLGYWDAAPYAAVGPAAHGFLHGRRFHYPRDLAAFLAGEPPEDDGPGGDFPEYAMLRLRLTEGLREDLARTRFGHGIPSPLRRAAEPLAALGLLRLNSEGVRLTREGFLLSNAVLGRLLDADSR